MRPDWFRDSVPIDSLIAPMVLFFQNNGIKTTQSCQGKVYGDSHEHLYGCPTIDFKANSLEHIKRVAALLKDNNLDTSAKVGLTTGFFAEKYEGGWCGQAQWIWAGYSKKGGFGEWDEKTKRYTICHDHYKELVYDRVIKLVNMEEINSIVGDIGAWMKEGRPVLR